jgi:hypothetical protein
MRCGRPIKADELAVRDIGRLGISTYHQRCAPTLLAHPPVRWARPPRGARRAIAAAFAVVAGWVLHRRRRSP